MLRMKGPGNTEKSLEKKNDANEQIAILSHAATIKAAADPGVEAVLV